MKNLIITIVFILVSFVSGAYTTDLSRSEFETALHYSEVVRNVQNLVNDTVKVDQIKVADLKNMLTADLYAEYVEAVIYYQGTGIRRFQVKGDNEANLTIFEVESMIYGKRLFELPTYDKVNGSHIATNYSNRI